MLMIKMTSFPIFLEVL